MVFEHDDDDDNDDDKYTFMKKLTKHDLKILITDKIEIEKI